MTEWGYLVVALAVVPWLLLGVLQIGAKLSRAHADRRLRRELECELEAILRGGCRVRTEE